MSVFTTWYVADDGEFPAILDDDGEHTPLELDGIGELELTILGELLGSPYEPLLVGDDEESPLLRLNRAFLVAMAAVSDATSLAARWHTAAEHLAPVPVPQLAETLDAMAACARDGLAGPGVVSMPSLG